MEQARWQEYVQPKKGKWDGRGRMRNNIDTTSLPCQRQQQQQKQQQQ